MSFTNDRAILANQLPISIEFPKEPERFYEVLTLWQRRVSNAVNTKIGGLYVPQELFSFKQYFTVNDPDVFRNVYRFTYDMVALNGGPIAAGATVAVPHNIPLPTPTSLFNGVNIYGSATNSDTIPNGPKRMPLPYSSSTTTRDIEIYLDNVNVTLINGSTQTILTYATIVAEYLKN
jgi:hypothetical protein